jgi:O-antigen ligase
MRSVPRSPSRDAEPALGAAEKVAAAGAWLTVVLTTWGFAGRASWAPFAFTCCATATALLTVWCVWREGLRVRGWAFAPLGLLLLYAGAGLLNPSHYRDGGALVVWVARPEWIEWLPSTVDRTATLQALLPWVSALALGGALREARLGRKATRWLWGALLAHGLVVALVGAYFFVTRDPEMLGFVRARHGYHFSSFVYRNHWAAYAVLLMSVGLGFGFSALRRWRAGGGSVDQALPGFGAAILLGVTIPMPGSRSGTVMALGLLGAALLGVAWLARRPAGRRGDDEGRGVKLLLICGFMAAVLAAGVFFNRGPIRDHWARTVREVSGLAQGADNLRLSLTRDTVRMALDRPVWGWGLGSYLIVFPQYQGDYLRDKRGRITSKMVHAHNDWAHIWAELGLVGGAILWGPAAWLAWRAFRTRGVLVRWTGGGLALIAVYGLVDFPAHCPAVLFLGVTLLATAAEPVERRE